MAGFMPYIRFIVLVAAGLAGVVFALLSAILEDHLKYLVKKKSERTPEDRPSAKPAWMWVAYVLSILIFVIGGALTAVELLPKPTVYITSPVEVGRPVTVTVKTVAGVGCTIKYITPSGSPSTSQELDAKEADANGICAWCWQIGTNTTPGTGQVIVTVGDESKKTYQGMIEIVGPAEGP